MKSFVFTTILASQILLVATGCKKEIDPNAYMSDPNLQRLLSESNEAERELKVIEDLFLDAQKKYLDAKSIFADNYDLAETYYLLNEKLEMARRKSLYYRYRLKYEKFAAQERYLKNAISHNKSEESTIKTENNK